MAAGVAWLLLLAWFYGRAERKRLGSLRIETDNPPGGFDDLRLTEDGVVTVSSDPAARRPQLLVVNAALTVGLLAALVAGVVPLPVLFMAGFAVATLINYPRPAELRARIAMHAPNVIAMTALIFAAGVFTGVLSGTGMVEAMPKSLLAAIPDAMGPYMAPITAALSLPMTFFVSNDAFYFGVVPVLAEAGGHYGVAREAIGAASLIGQPFHLLSPLVPSTYLLVSLAGVEFGAHQRFTFGWAIATCAVMGLAAALLGVFPVSA
jgi:CitMHS family citrate-Mg2+:H+ or citrate-Ca2+:H+ symporter